VSIGTSAASLFGQTTEAPALGQVHALAGDGATSAPAIIAAVTANNGANKANRYRGIHRP
jgi:hypothetical protein